MKTIYNSRNSKDLIVRFSFASTQHIYNSRNSKDLIVYEVGNPRVYESTTVEIQKT